LCSVFPHVDDLCEIVLRRHAIVHAGGIATSEYINKAKKLRKLRIQIPNEGASLSEDSEYLSKSWCIIYAAGVVLLHFLSVNHARNKDSKEDESSADDFLALSAYNAIRNEQYFAAELVQTYALSRSLRSQATKWQIQINLAQTYKWLGREAECTELLNSIDFTACSAVYRVCIASLRGDFDVLKKNLIIARQEGGIKAEDLYEWPVFKAIRETEAFASIFKDVFEMEFNLLARKNKTQLLDFDSAEKLSKFMKESTERVTGQ